MVRKIITIDKNELLLELPDAFVGKRIEIIAFPIDDHVTERPGISSLYDVVQIDTKRLKFNRDEANER